MTPEEFFSSSAMVELPSWHRFVQMTDLVKSVTAVVPREDVAAVLIFGSAVRPPVRRFLFFKKMANDIDIMVMSKCPVTPAAAKLDECWIQRVSDGYGSDYFSRTKVNAFDVVSTDASAFAFSLQRDEEIARNVVKEGVVLVGEWSTGHYAYRGARHAHAMRTFSRVSDGRYAIDTSAPRAGDARTLQHEERAT